ncbi:hypothetical protein Fmac_011138 [Flemingia macrophylla]|uniref:Large ribosomal subunit protein eL14 domain-containing protein n=1 Tax=Flemingia macrophylla TaxID=520843 RepID=A0ABD1MMD8_9FABA
MEAACLYKFSLVLVPVYVKNMWEKSSWGKNLIVQKKRASFNDFDRFKIMLANIKGASVVRHDPTKLKKASS